MISGPFSLFGLGYAVVVDGRSSCPKVPQVLFEDFDGDDDANSCPPREYFVPRGNALSLVSDFNFLYDSCWWANFMIRVGYGVPGC